MNDLLSNIFGDDYLHYEWDKGLKRMIISPDSFPCYEHDYALWEETLPKEVTSSTCLPAQPQSCSSSDATNLAMSPGASSASSSLSNPSSSPPTSPDANTATGPAISPVTCSPNSSASSPATSSVAGTASSPATNPTSCLVTSQTVDSKAASASSYFEVLRVCAVSNSTRGEIASFNFPPVVQIANDNIQLVFGPERLSNPLNLTVRPSECALTEGNRLIHGASGEDSDDEDLDIAVKFGHLGVFDWRAIDIWMKASKAASIKRRAQEEKTWLCSSNGAVTPSQIEEIRTLLFNSEPQQEVLRIGDLIVDANDLSTLVGERYLTGFVIDAACLKYSEEAMSRGSCSLYLPSSTQTWASSNSLRFLKSKLQPYVSGRNLSGISWILTPIHVNGNHWGLLCLNMVQQQIFYDDGLKQNHPSNIPEIVENLLKAVSCSSQTAWNISLPLQRFGMPKQPSSGEGSASCGVGVVLATHDFLNTHHCTIPKFH